MQTLLQKWEQAAIIALLLKTSFTDLQLYTWSFTVRPDYYRQHLSWKFVLDAIASPSSYPCKVVGHSLIDSFRLHLSSLQACSESSLFNVMNSNLFNLDFHLLSEPIIWMLKECGSTHNAAQVCDWEQTFDNCHHYSPSTIEACSRIRLFSKVSPCVWIKTFNQG